MSTLLTTGNPKIEKGLEFGYLPFILHLAPADLSGFETCPKRTIGCSAACLNTAGRGVGEGVFEVVLTVTVTAKLADKTVFLVEVGQAGIFRIMNVPEEQVEPLIAVACPNILFPYARETVSDAVTRAGFSPIVLQPVNFESMYMARMQEQQAPAETLQ